MTGNLTVPRFSKKLKPAIWWGSLVAALLLAFFLRFYKLGTHPLGIFFDPAINGLDAVRLMQRGGHVLFFPTNGGRESLFIYLLIPFLWLFDTTPFAIRALTAGLSLLNVALLFAFLRDVPQFDTRAPFAGRHPEFFALLAALILAAMNWAVFVSRLGQRPVLVPLLAVPIFWLFLRGWATGQRRWFAASGVLLGLAGYTYGATRLLPLILLLAVLPEFFLRPDEPRPLRRRFKNLLLLAATAALVYAPMAWYLLNHPAQFTARAGSVMVWNFLPTAPQIAAELGRNALRVAGFFCCAGSPNPIFGPPGYPGLSPLLAPFLLAGLVIAAKNWRGLFERLVLLWWLIGVAPSAIAIEAPHPLRMIAALPPTAILTALGLLAAAGWLRSHLSRYTQHATHLTFYALPVLLILLPLPGLTRAYFVEWTARQDTRGVYDYGAIAIRDAVLARAAAGQTLYLPQSRFNDSTLLYYLSGTFQRQARLNVPPAAGDVWVISPEKNAADAAWVRLENGTATVLPPLTEAGQAIIRAALSGPAVESLAIPYSSETAARIAPLPADPAQFVQPPTTPLAAQFGPLKLTGAAFPPHIDPAAPLPVTLVWQAAAATSTEYEILVRLVDDARQSWGSGDARPTDWVYPTSFWRPAADDIAAAHTIRLQNNPPPGRYWLAVSVFEQATGRRLPLAAPGDSPDTLFVGPLKVALPPPDHIPPPLAEPPTFGGVAQLAAAGLQPAQAAPGDTLQLELLWRALAPPPQDYTVFVHLLDENDQLVAGSDSQPLNGRYPTTIWQVDETILDTHTLPLPQNLPPGTYRLALGLYHQPSGQRLPLEFPTGQVDPAGRYILPQPVTIR